MLDENTPNHPGIGPGGDLDDAPFRPPPAIHPGHPNQGPVAVQDLAHLVLVEKDIGTAVVGDKEAVTIRMALHPAGHQTGPFRQEEGPLAVAHQLAFPLHGTQAAFKSPLLLGQDIEQGDQFLQGNRPALLLQYLGNVFPGRQGKIIAGLFPFQERIAPPDFG